MIQTDWQHEMDIISKSFAHPIKVDIKTNHGKCNNIRVLIVSPYMMYPFTSGGILRMVSPLTKMSKDDILIDFLFSTVAKKQGELCKSHLEKFDVIHDVYYSVLEKERPLNDNLPKDVTDSMSLTLLEKILDLIHHNDYNIIQVEHSHLSWIVPFIRITDGNCKIILDEHNIEYHVYEKWLEYDDSESMKKKCNELKSWETKIWKWYDTIMTVSENERKIISDCCPNTDVIMLPTGGGVDLEKYQYHDEPKEYDIIYIGSQDWVPNVHGLLWFINDVFPIIMKTRPGTTFHIMGNGASRNELIAASKYSDNIKFLGFQMDDVGFFHKSKVLVVPLFIGAGARAKIPTAMAASTPVVSTTFGAEGSGTVNGENILLADDPVDFAGCVLKILNDRAYADKIIHNAKNFVKEYYSVEMTAAMQKDVYRRIKNDN